MLIINLLCLHLWRLLIASDFVFPDHVVLLSSENNFETFRSINNLIKTKKDEHLCSEHQLQDS